ncbi:MULTISPECIES: nitrile hydratase subunit beta [unclassified Pseudomonas]|uniref:nitrile hydratase subunit beta n=1 Tax=unclassified Pseudomonas TaxID=196821 RepID=UPI0025E9F5E2|nr:MULTISPECIES: nitrile hydratase subunit beta [unclassified Pseudomonas]
MDGMHDLGGKEGFGPVKRSNYAGFYQMPWELRVHAIGAVMIGKKFWCADEQRHAIERMEPRHYMNASYYERQLTAFLTLAVEKDLCGHAELCKRAEGGVPLSLPAAAGRAASGATEWFQVGQKVRVKDEFVPGHTRFPGYVRGRTGVIAGQSAPCHFPDAAGHALDAALEMTYDLCFEAKDLWPESCDDAQVHFTAFHSYLELVEDCTDV